MTAKPRLTKVTPGKWDTWPTKGLVQVSPATTEPAEYWPIQTVYLDGVEIGRLEVVMWTERVKIAGTRLGRDLKRKKVWTIKGERFKYRQRNDAIKAVLNDWLQKNDD